MSVETDLYSALSTDAGVSALVGLRVYPDLAPVDVALPAMTFGRTQTEYVNTIHGSAVAIRAQLEVVCMAGTREAADAVADAVEVAVRLDGFATLDRRGEFDSESLVFMATVVIERWN